MAHASLAAASKHETGRHYPSRGVIRQGWNTGHLVFSESAKQPLTSGPPGVVGLCVALVPYTQRAESQARWLGRTASSFEVGCTGYALCAAGVARRERGKRHAALCYSDSRRRRRRHACFPGQVPSATNGRLLRLKPPASAPQPRRPAALCCCWRGWLRRCLGAFRTDTAAGALEEEEKEDCCSLVLSSVAQAKVGRRTARWNGKSLEW